LPGPIDRVIDRRIDRVLDRRIDRVVERVLDRVIDRVVERVVDRVIDRGGARLRHRDDLGRRSDEGPFRGHLAAELSVIGGTVQSQMDVEGQEDSG